MKKKGKIGSAYTRQEYIRGGIISRTVKYTMGNPYGSFEHCVKLVAIEDGFIRSQSIEAARVMTNKLLERKLGSENYYFRILIHPHHIIRQNKMLAFAGADRLQKGMRLAFGKPKWISARIKRNKPILEVFVKRENIELAKEALKLGRAKISPKCKILIESLD